MITENKIIKKYLSKLSFKNKKSLNLEDDVYYDNTKKIVLLTQHMCLMRRQLNSW